MNFVVFGPEARVGAVHGDRILDLARAAREVRAPADDDLFSSLLTLIDAGERGLDLARTLIDKFEKADQPELYSDLATSQLHAPFPGRRFALAGSNNADHVANAYTNRGQPVTAGEIYSQTREGKAGGFWVVSQPVGPDADIEIPRGAHGLFDYEGELAVVLGKPGKRIAGDHWKEHIWGRALVIDWSIRAQTLENRLPFYAHKNFDCSKSIGPWIAVDEVDPTCCQVQTRVNGQLRQDFNTRDMIHSFAELLEQISEDLTLLPGDVLSGGTGPGTAVDSTVDVPDGPLPLDLFLKAGDTVEVRSPGLGVLSAHVVAPS